MTALLLLLKDVEDLGRSGDVVKVKPGFARNFLLPRGLGIVADKNALRMQERLQEERKQRASQDKMESEELASKLKDLTLTARVKVDQEGHMYGSVSALDVVHLLAKEKNFDIEKRSVMLKHPIKSTGKHKIEIKLKEGVTASFSLSVEPEAEGQSKVLPEPEKQPEA